MIYKVNNMLVNKSDKIDEILNDENNIFTVSIDIDEIKSIIDEIVNEVINQIEKGDVIIDRYDYNYMIDTWLIKNTYFDDNHKHASISDFNKRKVYFSIYDEDEERFIDNYDYTYMGEFQKAIRKYVENIILDYNTNVAAYTLKNFIDRWVKN